MSPTVTGNYFSPTMIAANPITSLRANEIGEATQLAPDAEYIFADGTRVPANPPASNNSGVVKYFAATSKPHGETSSASGTKLEDFIKKWTPVDRVKWLGIAREYEHQALEISRDIGEKLELLSSAEHAYVRFGDLEKALEMALERIAIHYHKKPDGSDGLTHNTRGLTLLRAAELCGKLEAQGKTYKDNTEQKLLTSAIEELELGFPNSRDDNLLNANVRLARLKDPVNADQREKEVLWSFVRRFDGLNYLTFMADAFTRLYDILETELSAAQQAGDKGLIQMREAEMSRVRAYAKVIDGRFQGVYHVVDFARFLETNIDFLREKKNIDPSDTYLRALKYFRRFVADATVTDREVALLRSAIDVDIKAAADKLSEGVPMMALPAERNRAEILLREAQNSYVKIINIIDGELGLGRLEGSDHEAALLNNGADFAEGAAMIRMMLGDKDGAVRFLEKAAYYRMLSGQEAPSKLDYDLAQELLLGTFDDKMNAMASVLVEKANILENQSKFLESAKLRFAVARAMEHAGNHEMAGAQYFFARRNLLKAGDYFQATVVSDHIIAAYKKSGVKHAYIAFVDEIRQRRRVARRRYGHFIQNAVRAANDWTVPNILRVMAEAIVTPKFRATYFANRNWIPASKLDAAIDEVARAQQLGNRNALKVDVPGLPPTLEI